MLSMKQHGKALFTICPVAPDSCYCSYQGLTQKNKAIGSKDQFRYIKIQPKTIDLITRLWGINTEFVGFIPQSLVLRPIVLS